MNIDTLKPYTLKEYKQYNRDIVNIDELSALYNNYLIEWKEYKTTSATDDSNYRSNIYKEFLKNIELTNIDPEIKIYLDQIDYDDPYELDLAVHYFTINLNNEINRTIEYRDEIKFTPTKNNLKASAEGVTKYLKAHLMRLLKQDKFKTLANVSSLNIAQISNKVKINLIQYASNNIIGDESGALIDSINRTDFKQSIKNQSKDTLQVLKITNKGKKKYLKSSFKSKVSVNVVYDDWSRLPVRYFANEKKTIDNLVTNLADKLKEKYLGTDVFQLSGDGTSYTLNKIFQAENKNSYLYKLYNPIAVSSYGALIKKKKLPYQLSFGNTGLATALSKNLSFNVNLSALNGEFIIPDPYRVQPGQGATGIKKNAPINFNSENSWIKNNENNSINVVDRKALKSTGYQSRENSLEYSPIGINKVTDEISFWNGSNQIDWKNSDVYKRESLNVFPEAERFNDLLIKNNTATQIKNDIFGNEFILYKSTSPKRYGDSSFIISTSTTIGTLSSCAFYDGLYFNGVLSAISAADPSTYDSLTAVFDTSLYNDVSTCTGLNNFSAPLTGFTCDEINNAILSGLSGDHYVDAGPFVNHPCKSSDFVQGFFVKTQVPFNTLAISNSFTTTYELTSLNNPTTSVTPIYDETYTTPGSAFVRDITSQKIYTLYEKLSGVFLKLPTSAQSAISANEITNLDIVGSTIYIQTSANTFTEKYNYDGDRFTVAMPSVSLLDKSDIDFYN